MKLNGSLSASSLLHVARLYKPSVDGVKNEVLKLARATPPFSYEDLHGLVWDNVRWQVSASQILDSINNIGQKVKRDSYARAFPIACKFFEEFRRTFVTKIESRTYSIGRGMRVPFAPTMICGTPKGLVIPWLLFWKVNPLTEEQLRLFISMAMDVIRSDGEIDGAELLLVDTSSKSLRDGSYPKIVSSDDVILFSESELRVRLEIFATGFSLAQAEWIKGMDSRVRERAATNHPENQSDLFDF